jgi:hypothetical protein
MLNLNATLDNLIAMVVVLLALSLVVQAVQSAVKKAFKLKSRQIEDSLAHLFQFVLHNEKTAAGQEPGGRLKWLKTMFMQSPFLRIFSTIAHPADRGGAEAATLFTEVMDKFKAIGRTAITARPIFDSLSKSDLMNVVGSINPNVLDGKFADKVKAAVAAFNSFLKVFDQWKDFFAGPGLQAGTFLGDDDRAKLAELQAKFKPLVSDLALLGANEQDEKQLGAVIEKIAGDIAALRAINFDDVQKVLNDLRANVRRAAESARLNQQDGPAQALDALDNQLGLLAEGFATFRRAYDAIFANLTKLEQSFDAVMQSFEERYTRSMKTTALVISFLVVAFLNANFFTIYKQIATSDATREIILQSRENVVKALTANNGGQQPSEETIQNWFKASKEEINKSASTFEGYGFAPITWNDTKAWASEWRHGDPTTNLKHDLKVLLGWLVMALLLSVGAPFWQDFLESLFGVKNVLRKKSDTQNVEDKPGAGQTKQA